MAETSQAGITLGLATRTAKRNQTTFFKYELTTKDTEKTQTLSVFLTRRPLWTVLQGKAAVSIVQRSLMP